jgi:pyroglutamyl-peptidase
MRVMLFVMVLASSCLAQAQDGEGPVVLVTAFGAFAGRTVNGSATVAKALDGTVIAGATVRTLILPVCWGEPERRVPEAITLRKPILVLGLGEGEPGRVAVERFGSNRAHGVDQAGAAAPVLLDARGLQWRELTLRFDPGWCRGAPIRVVRSVDAGDFLCNDLCYLLAGRTAPRCGFIHVPPQGAKPAGDYASALVPVITAIVAGNLADLAAAPAPR